MEVKAQDCSFPKKECKNNGNCEPCRIKHKMAGNLPYCLIEKTLSFDSNGVSISYTKSGDWQPLIFVHGNMGSNQFFKDCPKLFKGYTVCQIAEVMGSRTK